MVGTPESSVFFEQAMPLARRSLGLQYDRMEYGEEFRRVCKILFGYQYIREKSDITDAHMEWLYEHSGGNISVVVSLIHDAQEISILSGYERLDMESLTEAYQKRLSLLHGYIEPSIKRKKQSNTTKKNSAEPIHENSTEISETEVTIEALVSEARTNGLDVVDILKQHITVVEVRV